jgi:spermidine/putrescine transport system permease protein
MARLSEFDYSVIEAAYDLGAREVDALLKVIIPMSIPGIISGFLMAITLSLDDFVITFFVSGPGSTTLPLHIYSMIRFGVSPVVNALSVILIIGSVILALSSKRMYKYMFSR